MILQYLPDSKEVIGELIEHIFCPKGIFWLCDSCQVNNAAAAFQYKIFSHFQIKCEWLRSVAVCWYNLN